MAVALLFRRLRSDVQLRFRRTFRNSPSPADLRRNGDSDSTIGQQQGTEDGKKQRRANLRFRMIILYVFREARKNVFAAENSPSVADKKSRCVSRVNPLREKQGDNLQCEVRKVHPCFAE